MKLHREYNYSIPQVGPTVLELLGVEKDINMMPHIDCVSELAKEAFDNKPCEKIFIYNPDAIASWIYEKYEDYFKPIHEFASLRMSMQSVFPPVTPACFGSMYTGLMPKDHGIQKYEKYVLKKTTIFDKLIEAGKKVAIVSTENDSISILFLERDMDYFIYKSIKECNEKAMELIDNSDYDVILLYNGNYDYWMHRNTPTGPIAKNALKQNINTYKTLYEKIKTSWSKYNTTLMFCPDHGCHRWMYVLGNHGLDIELDMHIKHLYTFIKATEQ